MTGAALALWTGAKAVARRDVTWCCGNHRAESCCESSKCVACCPECPTCPQNHSRTAEQRALDARELRERRMHTRMQVQRAELVVTMGGLDDLLAEVMSAMHAELDASMTRLARATASAAAVSIWPTEST